MNCAVEVREEVQGEQRSDAAVALRVTWQASNASRDESQPVVPVLLPSKIDERDRGIAARDGRWMSVAADRVGERPGSTTYIKPVGLARDSQRRQELKSEAPTPPAHEVFVGRSCRPLILQAGDLVTLSPANDGTCPRGWSRLDHHCDWRSNASGVSDAGGSGETSAYGRFLPIFS